jgi:hypothetical protein
MVPFLVWFENSGGRYLGGTLGALHMCYPAWGKPWNQAYRWQVRKKHNSSVTFTDMLMLKLKQMFILTDVVNKLEASWLPVPRKPFRSPDYSSSQAQGSPHLVPLSMNLYQLQAENYAQRCSELNIPSSISENIYLCSNMRCCQKSKYKTQQYVTNQKQPLKSLLYISYIVVIEINN